MDQGTLQQLIEYDPETGVLTWIKRSANWFTASSGRSAEHKANNWNACFAGKPAVSAISPDGYLRGSVLGKSTTAHRVAWIISNGSAPPVVDHINGVRHDNRLENLRGVTVEENNKNLKRRSENTGVCLDLKRGKWMAHIGEKGKMKNLGRFDSKDEAKKARSEAMIKLGYHENHGRQSDGD